MAEAAPAAPAAKKKLPMTLILIVAVTVLEAVGFFVAMKMFGGGPQPAHGAEGEHGEVIEGEAPDEHAASMEIQLVKNFRAPNRKGGRPLIFDMDVLLKVSAAREEEVNELIESRSGEISDRMARIIRGADPALLFEADLKTLRLQIAHAIGEVAHDPDLVMEVLIPRCVPIRGD